jgi:PPOX class probable F420-dependent enzyme
MGDKALIDSFLAEPRMCRFSVTRKNGGQLIRPIWYIWENERFVISTKPNTIQTRILRRNSKISICVDKDDPPYRAVICEGTAEIIEGLGTDHELIGRCAERYLPADRVEGFLSGPQGQIERCRLIVTPERWTIWDYYEDPPRGPSPGFYD